jgi:hypothetical protein
MVSSNVTLGLILAVASWPFNEGSLDIHSGFTASWTFSLAAAAHMGLPAGTRMAFAYGPLGFLIVPNLYFSSTAIASFLFLWGFSAAIFAVLLAALRRVTVLPLALLVAFVVGATCFDSYFGPEPVLALAVVGYVALLDSDASPNRRRWTSLGVGAALGIFVLIKASIGIGLVVIAIICVVSAPASKRRFIAMYGAFGAVPVALVGWFATSNGLGNVSTFLRSSYEESSGYGSAVSLDLPSRWYSYWLALFAILVVGGFVVVHVRRLERRVCIGMVLVSLIALWLLFKEGFVRHDAHDIIFFAAIPVLLAAFRVGRQNAAWLISAMLAMTLVTIGVAGFPAPFTNPVESSVHFAQYAGALARSNRRASIQEQSRGALQSQYNIPSAMIARASGRTVDIDPSEQTVVWAYPSLRFDPLPTIQDYSAYTSWLDHLDTSFLASAGAPEFIFRMAGTAIDNRDPAFEPPSTQLAIECRYQQVAMSGPWQLVEHMPDRCGRMRMLGTEDAASGQTVVVPTASASDAVVASFRLSLGLWYSVEDFLFKVPAFTLSVNDGKNTWRFVPGTAEDLHVLTPAANLGFSPSVSPTPIHTLALTGPSLSRVAITFYAVPFRKSVKS